MILCFRLFVNVVFEILIISFIDVSGIGLLLCGLVVSVMLGLGIEFGRSFILYLWRVVRLLLCLVKVVLNV